MPSGNYKLAVVSDVHGDVHGLVDALAAADRLGCDELVCLGDVVDHGLFPDEVIDVLATRRIIAVLGNHDRWSLERGGVQGGGWALDAASRRWLRGLPRALILERAGVRIALHHGSPAGDMVGVDPAEFDGPAIVSLLASAKSEVLLVGHTHRSFAIRTGLSGGLVANPGALLRHPGPGDDPPPSPGTFGVVTLPSCSFRVFRADGAPVDPALLPRAGGQATEEQK